MSHVYDLVDVTAEEHFIAWKCGFHVRDVVFASTHIVRNIAELTNFVPKQAIKLEIPSSPKRGEKSSISRRSPAP